MHAIYFYKDKQESTRILDYMKFNSSWYKDSRIQTQQAQRLHRLLSGREPVLVSLHQASGCGESGSWDPLRDQFYSWLGWMGALSYCIILSRRKDPRREVKTKRELQDLKERGLSDEEWCHRKQLERCEQSSSPGKIGKWSARVAVMTGWSKLGMKRALAKETRRT